MEDVIVTINRVAKRILVALQLFPLPKACCRLQFYEFSKKVTSVLRCRKVLAPTISFWI